MRVPVPRLYLGTMTFAWTGQTSSVVDEAVGLEMVKRFVSYNDNVFDSDDNKKYLIDTARIYAGGKTEPMVGSVLEKVGGTAGTMMVGTKANPAVEGGLSKVGIDNQISKSLEELKISNIGEYYLHQPDTNTPLLESLTCIHDHISNKGTCSELGMSNYHAAEMDRCFQLCKENNLTPPTVYQGLYNPLNRLVEEELLPILKANKCSFVAFNPLAAGLLTGKHKQCDDDSVAEGRFKNNGNYLPRFYTDANFEAINIIQKACEKEKITMVEATYRWLLRHSALDAETDGILLGASSVSQLDENLQACKAAAEKGPLSDEMLEAFDKAWELTKSGAFKYWRSYSSDMPNRENLHQGASYTVKK